MTITRCIYTPRRPENWTADMWNNHMKSIGMGSTEQVLPVHTVGIAKGLTLVYEPRRGCEYHVNSHQLSYVREFKALACAQ